MYDKNNNKPKNTRFIVNNKGNKFPIKSKFFKGKLVAFEGLIDTTEVAYQFTKQIQESNPKLKIYFMGFPHYFSIEKTTNEFLQSINNAVIEQNIKYFIDGDVKKTIDNMNEHQINNRLNIFSGINYINMLPILARINKINYLHTHFNLIVVSNYINSVKAFCSLNQHIFNCVKFVNEKYIPKADNTYLIDANDNDVKKSLAKQDYEYFYEEHINKYRMNLLNMIQSNAKKQKVKIIPYVNDKNKLVFEALNNYNLFLKYINKNVF